MRQAVLNYLSRTLSADEKAQIEADKQQLQREFGASGGLESRRTKRL